MRVALRIDVDTLRGTRVGVPNLLRILRAHDIRATFFFSVGPDNMGRHLWRLIRPRFLIKMLRTRAASLYGWDILLRGTLWPGPQIGKAATDVIRAAAADGHEIGLHAWDHHRWQMHIDTMSREQIQQQLRRGYDTLSDILGRVPNCSAVPGWRCNDSALLEKEALGFAFNSDCRGDKVFRPRVNGAVLATPQIPVDLPTYDELVGQNGVTPENYNERLLGLLKPDGLNVLTI
ncbi:MAG TPA: polysaccharide deacetylase family protein, partial [Phycisphaerae bacterium]|nr:polysaccharide deacetylase family protein [Phycisphaerae bacterium]